MNTANKIIPFDREQQMNLPEPPVDPDFNLKGYSSFLFDTQRFLNSEFVLSSDPAAIGLGVILWAVAWQQMPCGSLPDDDAQLARLTGFGRDVASFRALKDAAMHGFIKCNDGRLYHRFLIETALEADAKRNINRANGLRGGRPSKSKENNHSVSENNPPVSKTEPEVTFSKPIEVKRSKENRREVNSSSSSACAPVPASPAAAVSSIDDLELTPELIGWAKSNGITALADRLASFKAKCRDRRYKPENPAQTFMQACAEDWAKLNGKAGLQCAGISNGGGAIASLVVDPATEKRRHMAAIQSEIKGIDDLFKMAGIDLDPTSQRRRHTLLSELTTLQSELATQSQESAQ